MLNYSIVLGPVIVVLGLELQNVADYMCGLNKCINSGLRTAVNHRVYLILWNTFESKGDRVRFRVDHLKLSL